MTDQPKFCKDCRHVSGASEPNSARCEHPDTAILDLVSGARLRVFAYVARSINPCAPDGKLFEAAE